ncbi:MAG TPA: transglutaminase-like domain-containing protein [Terriglobia bacterium]|nr:transglutaminase-like domain-containing protein [Terriglobia bacterium]
MTDPDLILRFARLMEKESEQIPLLEAALMIAQTEYPRLGIPEQLRRFSDLATQLTLGGSPSANIQALNHLLFEQEKLAGNEQEYDDPSNSFLNDVLDRKKGIPITLSVIYTEVGKLRGLPLMGVGLPGHFIVKYVAPEKEILLDPFHQGAILSLQDCARILRSHFGAEAELRAEHLIAATPKQILARMLNNLKGSYFRRRNYPRVLTLVEMSLAIDPASRQDIHDRGMVYMLLNRHREAAADLKAFLSLAPPDDPNLRSAQSMLHRIRSLMN